MSDDAIEHGFREGDKVWVQDADGKRHPGIFVGDNEASGWFGGGPSAYVAHPEAHQAEVVSIFRITPPRRVNPGGLSISPAPVRR